MGSPSHRYEVFVENVGSVYSGRSERLARQTFDEYVEQSRAGTGRAADEAVVAFKDGRIWLEDDPTAKSSPKGGHPGPFGGPGWAPPLEEGTRLETGPRLKSRRLRKSQSR